MIFVESPRSEEELRTIGKAVNRPLLANMVETGLTPLMSAAELQEMGFSIVIFPGGLARFLTKQATEFLTTLKEEGTTRSNLERMYTFQEQNGLLGLEEFDELGRKYAS